MFNNKEKFDDDELGKKMGDFFTTAWGDLKNFAITEKFDGATMVEILKKNKIDFNNPLNEESFRDTLKKFKDRVSTMNVTDVQQQSLLRSDEQNLYIEALVPGFDKGDIAVDIDENIINIVAVIEEETDMLAWQKDINVSYTFDEDDVDFDKVSSKLEKGILIVTIPKKEDEYEKGVKRNINVD